LYLIKIPWILSVSLSSGYAGESSVGTPLQARALQGIKNAQLEPQGSENTVEDNNYVIGNCGAAL
jgi:hypothetical protein